MRRSFFRWRDRPAGNLPGRQVAMGGMDTARPISRQSIMEDMAEVPMAVVDLVGAVVDLVRAVVDFSAAVAGMAAIHPPVARRAAARRTVARRTVARRTAARRAARHLAVVDTAVDLLV